MKKILSILLAAALIVCTFAACGNKKTDTSSDLAYVKDKGTLVIGITLFAPMDYYEEGNTTDLKGFEADFARAVCEKLGVTLALAFLAPNLAHAHQHPGYTQPVIRF